jgi:hypothetical protein
MGMSTFSYLQWKGAKMAFEATTPPTSKVCCIRDAADEGPAAGGGEPAGSTFSAAAAGGEADMLLAAGLLLGVPVDALTRDEHTHTTRKYRYP